jgi:RimJ/RimL family protein N-acetyltransferase
MGDFRHETDRLILRDWREADWPAFFRVTNTPAVMRWLGGVADEAGRAALRARIEAYRADHGHTFWAVERRKDGALLGFCGLKRSNQAGGPQGMMGRSAGGCARMPGGRATPGRPPPRRSTLPSIALARTR